MARRSPTLATALEDWLTVRSAGRGLSPNRTRAYRADIAALAADLAGPADQQAGAHTHSGAARRSRMLNNHARALTPAALDHLVCRWFARAGVPLPRGAAAHAFRHTVAMRLVGRGDAVNVVQALLGHASLSSRQIYIRAAGHHVREAAHTLPVGGVLGGSRSKTSR
jgi:integrase